MPTTGYSDYRASTRIYDGTATPNYITIPFIQPGATIPLVRPRPNYIFRLNRGQVDSYAHFQRGPDDPIITPVQASFTAWLDEQTADDVTAALCNPTFATPWLVNGATFVTAQGTGGSIISGAGTSFRPPQINDDPTHFKIHFEWLFAGQTPGTNDFVIRHEECHVPAGNLTLTGGEILTLTVNYLVYGRIQRLSAHTAGTNRTPAIA